MGSSFNCAIAACFTSTHSAPTDRSHCIHTRMAYSCPQSTQVTTFAYFAAQAATHERACRHVFPCQPRPLSLYPLHTTTLYTFSYAKCCLSAYAGKREKDRERKRGERGSRNVCLLNFRVLYVICDFRP